MYTTCESCGATTNENVELCPYCGKPVHQTQKKQADGAAADWDYCAIMAVPILKKNLSGGKAEYECQFQARSMGKFGSFTIAATDPYPLILKWTIDPPSPMGQNETDQRIATERMNDLIKILQNDGWEVLSQPSPRPWDYKFRRKSSAA